MAQHSGGNQGVAADPAQGRLTYSLSTLAPLRRVKGDHPMEPDENGIYVESLHASLQRFLQVCMSYWGESLRVGQLRRS